MTNKELFETYNKDVYRTCYYMLHHAADAEDVCQEVFITVFRSNWQQIEYLRTWLLRVTVNHCLNHIKKSRRQREKELRHEQLSSTGTAKSAQQLLEEKETSVEWAGYLSLLPVKQRTVISLRYVHDLGLSEIADILEIPVGTVKSRLHKGLRRMRSILEQQGYTWKEEEGHVEQGRKSTFAAIK